MTRWLLFLWVLKVLRIPEDVQIQTLAALLPGKPRGRFWLPRVWLFAVSRFSAGLPAADHSVIFGVPTCGERQALPNRGGHRTSHTDSGRSSSRLRDGRTAAGFRWHHRFRRQTGFRLTRTRWLYGLKFRLIRPKLITAALFPLSSWGTQKRAFAALGCGIFRS